MRNIRFLIIALLLVYLGFLFTHSLASINQDIGRHLAAGKITWQSYNVPKTNLFSYTEPDQPFINHHWLAEVIFYLLNSASGLKGLIIFKSFLLALSFFIIWLAVKDRASSAAFAFFTLFLMPVFYDRTDVRPEIFSYLFLAINIFLIIRAKSAGGRNNWYKGLWWLVLIETLWVNTHIYFALGPLLLLLLIADFYFSGRKEEAKKIWPVLAAVCFTTLLNPNGLAGALAPLTILNHYGYSVLENQNIFFIKNYGILGNLINWFVLDSIAVVFLAIAAIKKYGLKPLIFESSALAMAVIMGGLMIRNMGIFTITALPIVSLIQPDIYKKQQKAFSGLLIGALVVLIIITAKNYTSLNIPAGAQGGVNFITENKIKGPMFNNFDVGSYLIWKLYPDQKVFVDGRPEAYSTDFFQKIYIPMQEDPAVFKKYADQYHINYVFFAHTDITPWAQSFLNSISKNPDWPLVYIDDYVVIFLKNS